MTDSAATGKRTIIEMTDVVAMSLRHPKTPVIEGIDWIVEEGDFWVVAGLLGAGKTDFVSLIAGLMPPFRGTYRLFGQDAVGGDERQKTRLRLRMGNVFDGGQLLHDLTVVENVALPIRYQSNCTLADCADRVRALLEFVGLSEWATKRPEEISRNWRQRAGLARALALEPELLLLDSPLSGLDPRHSQWWLQCLAQLSAGHSLTGDRPLTIVVTGHDLRPWQGVARQFALLKDGRFMRGQDNAGATEQTECLSKEMMRFE